MEWMNLCDKFASTFVNEVVIYFQKTWITYKEQFIKSLTHGILYFSYMTTLHAKGQNSTLNLYIKVITKDL